ncbi:MAG: tRNA (guanine-N(7)-)-methyltransferase [Chloroflexus sp.]|jgi:tRNA (guanine-N7-)-methyltransferase|uniref:tRNA (guanine(46)-N(7))-methyltransferase TrmB n=1 Tax=Chloroflexus sp. TaxID=1904827 RepID=UPI0021DE58ED|nr:methyltransferase domain-containing protein [Chloroflexus sp.]GIV89708.1 MAG: tRNA (guanine-N(7)-)-methyltransferase [Chloroflexus sp.]
MGRGRYPARLKVTVPPPEIAARYYRSWPAHELYHHPDRFPLLNAESLFGRNAPLTLELGCATGEYICTLATAQPDACFVGVDIVAKPLYRAVERAVELGLENIIFLHADARLLYQRIPDCVLTTIILHFPPPLLRNRQRNQLLVSAQMLGCAERALVPGGYLSFLTDHPDLFSLMQELLPAFPRLRGLPASPSELAVFESHYHRRWAARGREIRGLRIERIAEE